MGFDTFFRSATGMEVDPYPHQSSVAEHGLPEVLVAPTGTGKTEAVVLGWLYRLLSHEDGRVRRSTPRWLAIALPTRGLVEQTARRVENWIANADLAEVVASYTVMGGEGWDDSGWRSAPTRPSVFVGTVDMLLSRALNRGYADRRWNWPISFGLFNNGVHFVFDEVQLMEVATKTSRQLQAFRDQFGTVLTTGSTWMSATLDRNLLRTVDNPDVVMAIDAVALTPVPQPLARRFEAAKRIGEISVAAGKKQYASALADAVRDVHRRDGFTLVVLNTVQRAIDAWKAISDVAPPGAEVTLLHSRFRPPERQKAADAALRTPAQNRIVVATQVLEAGIDIDADVLVTEAAPWPSLVQRAGRCNRAGDRIDARLLWIEPPAAPPYEEGDIVASVAALRRLHGQTVTPRTMAELGPAVAPRVLPVIRRRDVLQLFDTSPDLTGNDIDVSRYIRDGTERDVHVLWRHPGTEDEGPGDSPHRDELCPAPIGDVRNLLRRAERGQVWRLDHLDGKNRSGWVECRPEDLRPGIVIAVHAKVGGYSQTRGWDLGERRPVEPMLTAPIDRPDGLDRDDATVEDEPASLLATPYPLAAHLADVQRVAEELLDEIAPDLHPSLKGACVAAGALHDIGKAHPVWQEAARGAVPSGTSEGEGDPAPPVAKSGATGRLAFTQRYFRHELASLLVLLGGGAKLLEGLAEPDLTRYLVVAHHGRARLGLRRIPGEEVFGDPERTVVLGVVEGSTVGRVVTPLGTMESTELSFSPDGQDIVAEWSDRALELRDRPDLGAFRLGFLEAVVRLADWKASHEIMERSA